MPDFGIDKEIERLIREIYSNGRIPGGYDKKLANKVAVTISKAVAEGYGKKFTRVAWNSPDWEQIRNLERNVYQFSFAKTYEQLKATTIALKDNDGNILPFGEFREIARRINGDYNAVYLPTEYDTAIGSAQMGARWVQFKGEEEDFPNATYRTAGDENVRPSHALLEGVTLSLSDPDIDRIWPPKGWRCRCDMEQSASREVTDKSKVVFPGDTPGIFQTNLGKNGLVFPADHPYFTHLPTLVREAADNQNPWNYSKVYGKNKGYVYDNPLHNHGSDWEEEFKTAKLLADAGEKIILLPEINSDTPWQRELRGMVLPVQVRAGKNPDGMIGNNTVDLKVTKANTRNAVDMLLRKGAAQAEIVVIRLTGDIDEDVLRRAVKGRVVQTELEEVWIIKAGETTPSKYKRQEILKF